MTLTRKLALGLCLALLSASYSNSQSLDPATGTELLTTGNLLNLGGGLPWSNTVTGQAGGASGGNVPAYNPGTGNIIFGYTQATVSQSIAINTALANAGLGIQLSGYKYSWQIHNDLTNYASNRGTLTGNVSLTGATGNVLESFSYDYNQNIPTMTSFTGTQFFNNRYTTSQASNLTVSFTGKDQNFWAGYYGPRVHVDDVSLLYTIDPCKLNPAYSPTCSGFGNILNTNNLLDSTQGGSYLNQAFAINTALSSAGVGATVHGFNYGFNYRVGQSWYGCTATNQDGSCSWYMNVPAYANATVSLTNSSNQTIHSKSYSFTGDGTSGSVSDKYLLPSSMNQSLLGTGRIVGSASGTGSSIEGAWATMIYTADPCVANPLYSSNCKGYAFAMAKQLAPQSSSTVTYNDGTQTLDTTTGMPPDPAQPLPPPGSPPPAGSPPPPGSEPPPGSPPPPPGAQQPASNNPAGPPPANQPPPQGGSSSQPKAGEVKTADGGGSKSGPSLGNVMSMISSNQARIGNEAKSVVQAAESAAAQSAQSAQQQAETVASALTTQSISDSTTASSGLNSTTATSNSQTQNSAVALAAAAQTTVGRVDVLKSAAQPVLFDSTAVSSDVVSIGSLPSVANINAGSNTSAGAGNQASQYELFSLRGPTTVDVEVPQFEGIKIGGRSTLNDAIEQRFTPSGATAQEQRTDAVNRNVQPNELAGAVDINNIARQPAGYQAYSVAMPDVAFYAPKEIYRNQVNVDNARVLRQLSSDRLHHDLVNLQYK